MKSPNNNLSGKRLQSFDDQFPNAEPSFKTDDGMMKGFGDFDCDICGRPTPWFHVEMVVYLCSPDCLTHYRSKQR